MARAPKKPKQVEILRHDKARRRNIPTAELQSAAQRAEEISPFEPVTYLRQNPLAEGETRPRDGDLDPQIVWMRIPEYSATYSDSIRPPIPGYPAAFDALL